MNTLLFYIPLLALTDRQNYRRRLKYTRFTWAGGTFFSVVLLFQLFVLARNRFWFHILLMYLEYHTVVVLCQFFFVVAGNSFWCYVRIQCTIQLCGCVSFFVVSFWCYVHTQCTIQLCGCVSIFVVAGKLILFEYLTVTIVSQNYRELSL